MIFEGLFLPRVLLEKETWYIAAFPLKAVNTSGMPARIVAIDCS
jgi:kynurenine formamidase